ncbi:MAG: hypothetical protein HQL52_00720 [Magnetococcales bacterium]|nr:hypothetical protein [Magnetococcales bacterium]
MKAKWLTVWMAALVILLSHPFPAWSADNNNETVVLPRDPLKLLNALEKRRIDLDDREKWLDVRQKEMERLEKKLAERLAALETLREAIQKDLTAEKSVDDTNIARLAKIYSGMKAKAAAAGLETMDTDTAVRVLKVMREKTAAKVLGKMKTRNAVRLSKELGIPLSERRGR